MNCPKCGNQTDISRQEYEALMQDLSKSATPLEMARHAQNCKTCSMILNMANAIVSAHLRDSPKL